MQRFLQKYCTDPLPSSYLTSLTTYFDAAVQFLYSDLQHFNLLMEPDGGAACWSIDRDAAVYAPNINHP